MLFIRSLFFGLAFSLLLPPLCSSAEPRLDRSLDEAFRNPSAASRPMTWWHWMNGNVTKEGITADLAAMQRVGLRGCLAFNVNLDLPQGPAIFMQPRWLELVDHAVSEAKRLGLEFGVHNCDGWSQAGGPWISPEQSMKVLAWTTTTVEGARPFSEVLAAPRAVGGFYRDLAVIAYPTPDGETLGGASIRGDAPNLPRLIDGDLKTTLAFAPAGEAGHLLEFVYDQPITARSLTIGNFAPYKSSRQIEATLEVSADGTTFKPVTSFDLNWSTLYYPVKKVTVGFEPVTGRVFRLRFHNAWPIELGEVAFSDAARVHYWEAQAGWARQRQHGGETLAMRASPGPDNTLPVEASRRLDPKDVRVFRDRLDDQGRLTWDLPAGRWTLLRLGYTTTGKTNGPATDEGRGLECDKLDRATVRYHFEQYLGKLLDRYGSENGPAFGIFEVDSWESGLQNWTVGLDVDFQKATGYDLLTWMPLLTEGVIIDSYDHSRRMLWDWRRFLADRISEHYYGEIAKFADERQLQSVVEASGRQMFLYDPITYQRHSKIPMGEFWNAVRPRYGGGVRVDNRVAASTAHLMGKRYVASEAYTTSPHLANWTNHPFLLKPLGDKAFCDGVNQIIFHTFAHQPWNQVRPGMTMGHWGGQFHRNNTWWEPGRAWIQYISRCQSLLQSGRFSADVLFYLGEEVPNRLAGRDELNPPLPAGYDFDGCDFQALLEARVEKGRIVLPSGMEYRLLLLPAATTMRPHVIDRLEQLLQDGAMILGAPPTSSPSLKDAENADALVRETAKRLWNTPDTDRVAGSGRIFRDRSFEQVFRALDLPPDFAYQSNLPDAEVLYLHRKKDAADFYFLSNQQSLTVQALCKFRVTGKVPELWDPVSGTITPLAVYREEGKQTVVPVTLDPNGSVFIVFRAPSNGKALHEVALNGTPVVSTSHLTRTSAVRPQEMTRNATGTPTMYLAHNGEYSFRTASGKTLRHTTDQVPFPLPVAGPWRVTFPKKTGAPESIVLKNLQPLNAHSEFGVRHFSGTATYRTNFLVPQDRFREGVRTFLDLGEVQVMAEIAINGKPVGILWKPPFKIDISDSVKPGENDISIRVTNLWVNRLIGDAHFPESAKRKVLETGVRLIAQWPDWLLRGEEVPAPRIAFAARASYSKDDPLSPSGLVGPVQLTWSVLHAAGAATAQHTGQGQAE